MPSETRNIPSIVGYSAIAALLSGAFGGISGLVGGSILDKAGYHLDNADEFGLVGFIGGAELGFMLGLVALTDDGRLLTRDETYYCLKNYFFMMLAACVVMTFTMGVLGMSQSLSFNNTLMSNLEQKERIWTSGAACATGAAVIYTGIGLLIGAALKARELLNTAPRRMSNQIYPL